MACDALLSRYCKARDTGDSDLEQLEAEVLEANRGLAIKCVLRSKQTGPDHEQAAMVGLLRSLRDYDPDRGTELSTFAWPRMVGEIADTSVKAVNVRVPRGSYRAGGRAKSVSIEGLSLGSTASVEDDIEAVERESAMASVVECWRGVNRHSRVLAAAQALAESKVPGLWPRNATERIEVLARLDAALDQLEREHPVDAALWRAHHVDGRSWTAIADEFGVTRQRVAHRARRREDRLAEILGELRDTPREALVLWASRPPSVQALEQLGLADPTTAPLDLFYLAEDLEVALTELDSRAAAAWSARELGRRTWPVVAKTLAMTRRAVVQLVETAARALVGLLAPEGCAGQLALNLSGGASAAVHWWTPIASPPHLSGALGAPWKARSATAGRAFAVREVLGRIFSRPSSMVPGSSPGAGSIPGRPSLSGRRRSWLSTSTSVHEPDVRGVAPPRLLACL